jgi:hypothetical protein
MTTDKFHNENPNNEREWVFNHYCALHHDWWCNANTDDCPKCKKEHKKDV